MLLLLGGGGVSCGEQEGVNAGGCSTRMSYSEVARGALCSGINNWHCHQDEVLHPAEVNLVVCEYDVIRVCRGMMLLIRMGF